MKQRICTALIALGILSSGLAWAGDAGDAGDRADARREFRESRKELREARETEVREVRTPEREHGPRVEPRKPAGVAKAIIKSVTPSAIHTPPEEDPGHPLHAAAVKQAREQAERLRARERARQAEREAQRQAELNRQRIRDRVDRH